jgi:hypothetical protein
LHPDWNAPAHPPLTAKAAASESGNQGSAFS